MADWNDLMHLRLAAARRSRIRRVVLALTLVAAAIAVSACGSSSDGGSTASSGSTGSDSSTVASDGGSGIEIDAPQVLKDSFAGIVDEVPASGPKAVPGKSVWLLSCLEFEGCQRITKGITEAADKLGWNLKVVNNKAEPALTISEIREAISANADGIIEIPIDCPVIKSGLLAAKEAGIPVLTYGGLDCNHPAFGGTEELFGANIAFSGKDWADFFGTTGQRDAEMVLALAKEKGIEEPKIIQVRNDDQALQAEHGERFADVIESKCPACDLYPLQFTIAQLGEGKGPEVFKSGILAHPDANVLYYQGDFLLPAGLQAAMQTAAQQFEVVCCGDGGAGIENVRSGLATAAGAYPLNWAGWAISDVMNRLFAGESKLPSEGGESLYVDKTHNLPPPGKPASGSYDYKAAYEQVWTGE